MVLGEKLYKLRKENRLSQLALAETLDVSRQTVSRWECGTSVPSTDNLIALSRLYGVDVETLAGDSEERQPPPEQPAEDAPANGGRIRTKTVVVALAWVLSVALVCAAICIPFMFLHARQNEKEEDVIPIEEVNMDPANNFTVDDRIKLEPW